MEVTVHVATMCHASSLFNDGPTMHWVGPETLLSLVVEGQEVKALADSGIQVNMVMLSFVPCSAFWGSGGLPAKPDRCWRYKNKAYGLCDLVRSSE